jgi:hypothetical protein
MSGLNNGSRGLFSGVSGLAIAVAGAGLSNKWAGLAGGASAEAVDRDPIEFEVVGTTMPTQAGLIVGNGRVARIRFKGMATGLTLDANDVSLTVQYPTFSSGVAGTGTKTVTGRAALRRPLPTTWANGQTVVLLQRCTSLAKISGSTRIYQCANAGGTTATGSNPTHTSGSVTGADGIEWLYIGSIGDANQLPYVQPIQVTAGSDVDVYLALSDAIYDSDTVTSVTIASGAYGASNASQSAILTVGNSSTLAYEKPDPVSLTLPWNITGNSLDCRLFAFHPSFANGRTLDSVIYKVVDSTGAVVLTGSPVTTMVRSTALTGVRKVPEFYQSLDISSLPDGALYGLAFEAYPRIGDNAYKSLTDGFGSATPSINMAPTANVSKVTPFRKDAAGTFGRIFAYADSVAGNDGTGVASATAATAAASPFATISAAASAIQTLSNSSLSRNNMANHVIRLVGPSGGAQRTFVGFHGTTNTMSSRAKGDVWLTIERDPATSASAADVAITVAATAALKTGATRTKYVGITVTGTSSAASLDNQVAATVGEFTYETWFDGCDLTGVSTSTQRPITRMGLIWITNSALTNVGTSFGNDNTRSALKVLGGSTVVGNLVTSSSTSNCEVGFCNALGNSWSGGAVPAAPIMTWWAEGTGTTQTNLDRAVLVSCSWLSCFRTVKWPRVGQVLTSGFTYAQNLTEVLNTSLVKGGEHSADGNVTPVGHGWYYFNSTPGEGTNLLYNENGTTFAEKYGSAGFNANEDWNIKADWYDSSPETASGNRVGNLLYRYRVDYEGNVLFAATDGVPAPDNLSGEAFEASLSLGTVGSPLVRGWTDDRSATGTVTGGGNYRPTSLSALYAKVGSTRQAFPEDMDGNTRVANGNGAAGALEAA